MTDTQVVPETAKEDRVEDRQAVSASGILQRPGGQTGGDDRGNALALVAIEGHERAAEAEGDGGVDGVTSAQAVLSCDAGGLLGEGFIEGDQEQVRALEEHAGEAPGRQSTGPGRDRPGHAPRRPRPRAGAGWAR